MNPILKIPVFISLPLFLLISFNVNAQTQWSNISAGTEYSLGIKSNGTIWSWGWNANGQLGQGHSNTETEPAQIGTDTDWKFIEAGAIQAFAIKTDGTLWAWGINSEGQLGIGSSSADVNSPTRVGLENDWAYISSGMATTYGIKTNGTLWGWGWNPYGQIGDSTKTDRNAPVQIGTGSNWAFISAGGGHVLALKSDSSLWAWGYNGNGQLGIGSNQTMAIAPVLVDSGSKWIAVSAGFEFSLAVKADGTLWSWGYNGNGQLGIGNSTQQRKPIKVGNDNDWQQVFAGSAFAFAIKSDSTIYSWGYNQYGSLGIGSNDSKNTPVKAGNEKWKKIAVAKGYNFSGQVFGFHTLGLKADNKVICATGANYAGQLGNGTLDENNSFLCETGPIVSVPKHSKTFFAEVFPNPASDYLFIKGLKDVTTEINIYDVTGRNIFSQKVINPLEIEKLQIQHLPSGVYNLFIRSGESQFSKKIIINH